MQSEALSDDDVPDQTVDLPSKPPRRGSNEVLEDGTQASPTLTDNGSGVQQVVTLLKLHPFLDLFFFAAGKRYPRSKTLRGRVDLLRADHKVWFACCIVLDMLLTSLFSILLFCIVAVTAWKTLIGPLPWVDQ